MSMEQRERRRSERAHEGRAGFDLSRVRSIRPREYVVRFAFGLAISVIAAVAKDIWGPRFGGLFLAFPAILPATATLIERNEGLAQALSDIRGATLGAVGMGAFGVVAALEMRRSPFLALLAAIGAWVLVSGGAYLLMRALVRALGERQYLPEVPTSEAASLLGLLMERHLTIATAESCSAGAVAALLGSVPGASDSLRGSVVAYLAETKESVLDVPADLIEREGVVSGAVTAAMAQSVRRLLGAEVGVAVTGVTGDSIEDKPSGLTFIAVAHGASVTTRCFEGDLGPGGNDERAVRMALRLASAVVEGTPGAPPGSPADGGEAAPSPAAG